MTTPNQKTGHTPTPWMQNENRIETCDLMVEGRPELGGISVATIYPPADIQAVKGIEAAIKVKDANAAFIVRACNSHDALVAALHSASSELEAAHAHLLSLHSRNIDRGSMTNALIDGTLTAAENCRAALKLSQE